MGRGSSISSSKSAAKDEWNLMELAQWVPLRLSAHERKLLQVLEQTLNVSEYTDHVDVSTSSYMYYSSSFSSSSYARSRGGGAPTKTRRILEQILEACHIATGLVTASGHEREMTQAAVAATTLVPPGDSKDDDKDEPSLGLFPKKGKKNKKNKRLKRNQQKKLKGKKQKGALNNTMEMDTPAETSAWASRDPQDNAQLLQTMFEVGRRNKVLNPASMRTTYGKLMYLLQDASNATVTKSLGFSLHKDLVLVQPFLEQYDNGLQLLTDPRLECAIQYISDRDPRTGQKLPRDHVQSLVQGKHKVTQELVQLYGHDHTDDDDENTTEDDTHHHGMEDEEEHNPQAQGPTNEGTNENPQDDSVPPHEVNPAQDKVSPADSSKSSKKKHHKSKRPKLLTKADVLRVVESLADAMEYMESNVRPVQQMLQYLETCFDPEREEKPFSLALRGGRGALTSNSSSSFSKYGLSAYHSGSSEGPTLSHSHSTQYVFVWQSLRLWCKVMRHMHRLVRTTMANTETRPQ